MDRHLRPYKCDRVGCDAPAFGDAGGLFRHQREVHKSRDGDRVLSEYFCPDVRCERHTRGFPRRWNLMEHQRRIHGINRDQLQQQQYQMDDTTATNNNSMMAAAHQNRKSGPRRSQTSIITTTTASTSSPSRPMSPLSPRSESPRTGTTTATSTTMPLFTGGFPPSSSSSGAAGAGNTSTVNGLRVKLRELEDRKMMLEGENVKLGRDIEAVKHTLKVMEDGSVTTTAAADSRHY